MVVASQRNRHRSNCGARAVGRSIPSVRSAAHYTSTKLGKLISENIDLDWYRLLSRCIGWCADIREAPMRALAALTILTMSVALADGQARAQTIWFLRFVGL
jgi:hypothetical protein